MLLLQKAVTLPEEAAFTGAVTGGNRLAGPSAERVIMIVRVKASLRPRSARGYKAVFRIIRIVLFIKPAASSGQAAPCIVLHKQILPVLQTVISNRGVVRGKVIGGIIGKERTAALAGRIMLQQAAFGVIAVIHLATQGVAGARQLAAPGIAEQALQYRLLRQGHFFDEFAALRGSPAEAVIAAGLFACALGAADFPVQAVTGEFNDQLRPEADGADVTGAVVQRGELLPAGQGQIRQIAQRIPCIAEFTVITRLAYQAACLISLEALRVFMTTDTFDSLVRRLGIIATLPGQLADIVEELRCIYGDL